MVPELAEGYKAILSLCRLFASEVGGAKKGVGSFSTLRQAQGPDNKTVIS